MKNSKFINTVAASTFGVLLIHTINYTMRTWLWSDFLKTVEMYNSKFLVIHAIGSVAAIFIVCTIIDQLRIRFIEVPCFKVWDKHWNKVVLWYKNTEATLCKKLNVKEDETP